MQKKKDKPEAGKIYALTDGEGKPSIANGNTWAQSEVKQKDKPKKHAKISAYDLTDEQVAGSIGHEVSDFNDDGSDLDELRDIIEGGL